MLEVISPSHCVPSYFLKGKKSACTRLAEIKKYLL